jgi:hypothetical protein
LVALNVRHLQLTPDRPCNPNAIQKPVFGLQIVLKSLTKHFMSFGSGFTELHAVFDADTLLDFAIHHRQNET